MASTVSLEEVKKIISFPFKGERWAVKNLIGAALTFGNFIVPVIPALPALGYAARIMKHIIVDDEDPALPEWNDWVNLFLDGLKVLGVMFLFDLPAFLLMVVGYGIIFVPIFIISLNPDSPYFASGAIPFIQTLLSFCGMAVSMLGIILIYGALLFLPPALGNMIAKSSFGAAFQFGDWWVVFKKNFSGYLVAVVLLLGLYMIWMYCAMFMVYTVIFCCLLPFVMSFIGFFLSLVTLCLFAIAYRDGIRNLAKSA